MAVDLPEKSSLGSHSGHCASLPETDGDDEHASLPKDRDTTDASTEAPAFDNDAHVEHLLRTQHCAPSDLAEDWNSLRDYLYKRFGLEHISEDGDTGKHGLWSNRLGIKSNVPPTSVVELHDCVIKGAWPPSICDLSPGLIRNGLFPTRSPDAALRVSSLQEGYLVTVGPARHVSWKLIIQDPLSLLQIEREGWDCDPYDLILNLIKKGVPFQILHPQKLEGAQLYNHPGPALHPTGKAPTRLDYLAYRQELASFFTQYPHAYAAALSAGGIMWRIAMDVLPLPRESDITRQFHPNGCVSLTVDGDRYWTPRLTSREEEVIVGVYKWSACK